MPFTPVTAEKLSLAVIRQIEALILRGILRPGDRLPAERDLAQKLAVSRPSLRDALAVLQDTGLLVTRPGAGVYVADVLGSAFSPALRDLMSRHETAMFDYLSFRRDMEGLAAERAARLGSDTDLKLVDTVFRKMQAAHAHNDPAEEAALDAKFHMAIIEASHNIVMLHMMRSMYELLAEGVFYNRQMIFDQRTTQDELLTQHAVIRDALLARDPASARQAVTEHLDFVERSLRAGLQAAHNEDVARQRLAQEG